jgi:hypothetical protein
MTTPLSLSDSLPFWKLGAVVSAGALFIFIALRILNAPPAPTELKVFEARLLESPSLFAREKRVRLRFAVGTSEYCGVVDDYKFIESAIDRAAILNLSTNKPVRIGVQKLSDCESDAVRVWQIEQGGLAFLGLAATGTAANAAAERPVLIFLVLTVLFAARYVYARKRLATRAARNAA